MRVGLVQARSYRNGSSRPGPLVINLDLLSVDVRGRDVLAGRRHFRHRQHALGTAAADRRTCSPASVRTAVLLRKADRCQVPIKPDFVGFDIADAFVVGYGLDYHDHYRNLPYVAVLEPAEMEEERIR